MGWWTRLISPRRVDAEVELANAPVQPAQTAYNVPPSVEPTDQDRQMMAHALALGEGAALRGEVPVGAVVYELETGQVIGRGSNQREELQDPVAHAEIVAIQEAAKKLGSWRLEGCGLAVTLEPCPMCAGACVNSRLKRVVYGARDPKGGGVHSLFGILGHPTLNHRPVVVEGVEAERSGKMLKDFFRTLRSRRD